MPWPLRLPLWCSAPFQLYFLLRSNSLLQNKHHDIECINLYIFHSYYATLGLWLFLTQSFSMIQLRARTKFLRAVSAKQKLYSFFRHIILWCSRIWEMLARISLRWWCTPMWEKKIIWLAQTVTIRLSNDEFRTAIWHHWKSFNWTILK